MSRIIDAPKSLVLIDIDGNLSPVADLARNRTGEPLDPPRPEYPYAIPGAKYQATPELGTAGTCIAQHTLDMLEWLGNTENQDTLCFEPRWHTSWGAKANGYADTIGAPRMESFTEDQKNPVYDPASNMTPAAFAKIPDWKVRAIISWLSDPANGNAVLIWVDDEITDIARRQIHKALGYRLKSRLICVRTDTHTGITPQQVRFIKVCLGIAQKSGE